jgi:uncharacterized membrane protein
MALKTCEDCKKEISTLAISCPNCGRPNANAGIVTIEKTQKKWKRWRAWGFILTVFGGSVFCLYSVVLLPINPNHRSIELAFIALAMGVIGVLILIASGIGRWYHHG